MAVSEPITLNEIFAEVAEVYIKTFTRSYYHYGTSHGALVEDMIGHLRLYASSVRDNAEVIAQSAADGIGKYLNLYNIGTEESADEYKIIYFLGRAIEQHLPDFKVLRGAHLFSMIALLEYRLQTLGIYKENLTQAMTSLIRGALFDRELGTTGCYLIYKCVSTTERTEVLAARSPSQTKGSGIDNPRASLTAQIVDEK